MAGVIATIPKFQFSANGVPMVGGTLDTYIAGSTTPATTWQDSALTIANTNPISLDARGECVLWLDPAVVYKFVLKNAQGVIQWTQDNISNPAALANSLRADLAASSGASLVGFQQKGTGSVATTVQSKLRESVSITDFGAVGDGVTNDVLSIQAAINSGAKKIIAPAGKIFRITNTLLIDSDSVELDFQYSELLLDDAGGTKDHVMLGNGVTQRGGIKIHNVTFTRQQIATAGYAINSDFIGGCEIKGCRVYGNNEIHGGIKIYRGIIINIQNNYIENCVNTGIYLEGSGTGANRAVDVTIRENRVEGGVNALSTWDFVEGLFCRDNIFFNTSGVGVVVGASSNANGLVSFKFQENDFDTCGAAGLYIDKISNVQVTGCWFGNNGGDDLQLKELCDAVIVVGNQFYPSASAIYCYGNAARITGNLVSGGTTCIVVGATATHTDISGNTLSNAQYAINLGPATNTHFIGNSIYGMSAGAVVASGGTGTVVQNNKGDSAVGANAFIPVGASPFTYTAGPRPEYVSIFDGTVSNIQLGSNSIGFSTNRSVTLAPNQSVTVTYSAEPFMVRSML